MFPRWALWRRPNHLTTAHRFKVVQHLGLVSSITNKHHHNTNNNMNLKIQSQLVWVDLQDILIKRPFKLHRLVKTNRQRLQWRNNSNILQVTTHLLSLSQMEPEVVISYPLLQLQQLLRVVDLIL